MSRSPWKDPKYVHKSQVVDSFIFRLISQWTVCLLLAFSLIITCKLVWGDSFRCTASYDVPQVFLDVKCYSEYVYTLLPYTSAVSTATENDRRFQTYYLFVNILFLVQAFLFYAPSFLWKTYESCYFDRLTAGLQIASSKERKRSLEIHCLAKFLFLTQGKHNLYTSMYIFLESCSYVVLILLHFWLGNFFNVSGVTPVGQFVDVSSTWDAYRNFYFPPQASCDINRFSSSGSSMPMPAICVLPLNRLFMAMFLFLSAWYVLLVVLGSVVLVCRLALILPKSREIVFRTLSPLSQSTTVKKLCRQMSYSDWFFISTIRQYVTDVDFSKLVDKVVIMTSNREREEDERSSVYEDSHKDFDSTVTTPL